MNRYFRYYSTQRPLGPGTYPNRRNAIVTNFGNKTFCKEIGRSAWGYVEYPSPLTESEISDYELTSVRSELLGRRSCDYGC